MKVLLFANTDWYLYNFRLSLAKTLRERGAEVVLVSPPGPFGPQLRQAGFRWIAVPMERRSLNPIGELRLVRFLIDLYRAERPDLAHHFTIKCVVYGSLAARAAGVRACVNAVTGLGYTFSSTNMLARVLKPGVKRVLRLVLRGKRTRLILQNPDDCAEFLTHKLVKDEQLRMIRSSGVDTVRFSPRSTAAERSNGRLQVLLATRLLWDKGVAEFIEAARQLKTSGVTADFLIAGDADEGSPAAVPAAYVAKAEGDGWIRALGHVSRVDELLQRVDIVVLPSYREGVPRILVEAAASGVAIVATDVPGCREIIEHELNGLLVPPRDASALAGAIRRLALAPDERLRFGRAGRAKALAEFDERLVIGATLAVYEELIPIEEPIAAQAPISDSSRTARPA